MDEKKAPFTPEANELRGEGVDFWKLRRDVNAAERTNEDVWRERRHLADDVFDQMKVLETVKGETGRGEAVKDG